LKSFSYLNRQEQLLKEITINKREISVEFVVRWTHTCALEWLAYGTLHIAHCMLHLAYCTLHVAGVWCMDVADAHLCPGFYFRRGNQANARLTT